MLNQLGPFTGLVEAESNAVVSVFISELSVVVVLVSLPEQLINTTVHSIKKQSAKLNFKTGFFMNI